jgi:hypothetical protein
LRPQTSVLVAVAEQHAARLGDLLKLASSHGLAVTALFTVAGTAVTELAATAERSTATSPAARGASADLLAGLTEWLGGRSRAVVASLQAECAKAATLAALSSGGFGDCFCAEDPSKGGAARLLQTLAPRGALVGQVSSSDFSQVASVASDPSLPQTLVVCTPLAPGLHGAQLGDLLAALLAPPALKVAAAGHALVDALPFELLGLTVALRCSEPDARRVASACLAAADDATVTSLRGQPLLVACVRCIDGRRKVKEVLKALVSAHAHAGSLKPSPVVQVLCSKAPRAALSLMATFFPLEGALSADSEYPVSPWRGSAALPPRRLDHPFLAFFPPQELPAVGTVTVLSPNLSWLDLAFTDTTAVPRAPPHQRTPAVLVRVLRRAAALGLAVRSLALRRMAPDDWAAVPDLPHAPTPVDAAAAAGGTTAAPGTEAGGVAWLASESLCVVVELHGRHAISRWADAVGPPVGGLAYLAQLRGGVSTTRHRLADRLAGVRDASAALDGQCLRGQLPPQVPAADLGIYAAQSHADAVAMDALLPPRLTRGGRRGLALADAEATRRLERRSSAETACFVACHGLVQEAGLSELLQALSSEGFVVVNLQVGCLSPFDAKK